LYFGHARGLSLDSNTIFGIILVFPQAFLTFLDLGLESSWFHHGILIDFGSFGLICPAVDLLRPQRNTCDKHMEFEIMYLGSISSHRVAIYLEAKS